MLFDENQSGIIELLDIADLNGTSSSELA